MTITARRRSGITLTLLLASLVAFGCTQFSWRFNLTVLLIFIAGNLQNVSEIAPLLIMIRLDEFNYAGATALASAMLVLSFAILFAINLLQGWRSRHG